MDEPAVRAGLAEADITVGPLHRNLPAPELIARSLARGEGIFAANGALVVTTGERTGRSPADRYIVDEPEAADVAWNGVNQPCTPVRAAGAHRPRGLRSGLHADQLR
jgi:ATP-dependent phosphoenolpyruvate carboxykinase